MDIANVSPSPLGKLMVDVVVSEDGVSDVGLFDVPPTDVVSPQPVRVAAATTNKLNSDFLTFIVI